MQPRAQLRGVLVGTGYFSQFQLDAWSRIPEVEISAICDLSTEKTAVFQQKYGIPRAYQNVQEMILAEKPDFIDIVTPPKTHHAIAQFAAEQGVHIICQKPLADTYEEAVALAQMMSKYNVRFMVHENWRWQPWYRETKRLIEAGAIGQPFSLQFFMRMGDGWGQDAYLSRQPFFRDYPRLLVHETGIHFLDTFRYLFGEPTSVFAHLRQLNPVIKGEDSGHIWIQFAGGETAVLNSNRYNESEADNPRFTFGTMRIDGSEGHLRMDENGRLLIKKLGQPVQEHSYPIPQTGFAGDCVYALQRHFVEVFLEKRPFESSLQDYMNSINLVEAVYHASAQNKTIQL